MKAATTKASPEERAFFFDELEEEWERGDEGASRKRTRDAYHRGARNWSRS